MATKLNENTRRSLFEGLVGSTVRDAYYDEVGDYYVIEFERGEICVRFMSDLVGENNG